MRRLLWGWAAAQGAHSPRVAALGPRGPGIEVSRHRARVERLGWALTGTARCAQILNQLPRASPSGSLSNSNMGEYDLFKCKNVPLSERSPRAGDTCPAGVEMVDQASQLDSAGSPPAHSAAIYAEVRHCPPCRRRL